MQKNRRNARLERCQGDGKVSASSFSQGRSLELVARHCDQPGDPVIRGFDAVKADEFHIDHLAHPLCKPADLMRAAGRGYQTLRHRL
ncbi:MAG: hypothetical protein ACJARR_003044 [Pseudophaeobacter arcticus]